MRSAKGVMAAFVEANEAGGVHGHKLVLDSFEDGNAPYESVRLVRRIIRDDRHLAIIGMSGVQSARVVQSDLRAAGFPFLAPVSGDSFLRQPGMTHIRTIRPGTQQETRAWIDHLLDIAGLEKIAVLYQSDISGRQGLEGVRAALARRGLDVVAAARYQRNTNAVKTALLRLMEANPQVVVVIGEQGPRKGVRLARRGIRFHPDLSFWIPDPPRRHAHGVWTRHEEDVVFPRRAIALERLVAGCGGLSGRLVPARPPKPSRAHCHSKGISRDNWRYRPFSPPDRRSTGPVSAMP